MISLPFDFYNKLATQIVAIASLLGRFSLSLLVTLLHQKEENKYQAIIFKSAMVATSSFVITVFAMTNLLLATTQGGIIKVEESDLMLPRIIGSLSFFIGILSIVVIITLSGYAKSPSYKRFSLICGLVTLIMILLLIS
jgi:hypothetical protein